MDQTGVLIMESLYEGERDMPENVKMRVQEVMGDSMKHLPSSLQPDHCHVSYDSYAV